MFFSLCLTWAGSTWHNFESFEAPPPPFLSKSWKGDWNFQHLFLYSLRKLWYIMRAHCFWSCHGNHRIQVGLTKHSVFEITRRLSSLFIKYQKFMNLYIPFVFCVYCTVGSACWWLHYANRWLPAKLSVDFSDGGERDNHNEVFKKAWHLRFRRQQNRGKLVN